MLTRWTPFLLTISQAFLAGALPAPRIFGQSRNLGRDCDDEDHSSLSHGELLTSVFLTPGAHAAFFTDGPPFATSYPNGNPFTNTLIHWNWVPRSMASATVASPSLSYETAATTTVTGGTPSGLNNGVATDGTEPSTYMSTITFVDPHLSIQTVTVTQLSSSQNPTVTSASQSFPDTSGVRNPPPFVAKC